MTRRSRRRAVVRVARHLRERGLVVDTTGNVSAREDDAFIITPTRQDYGSLRRAHLVKVPLDAARPPARASREWLLHQTIYRIRSDVGGIVHTHSAYATAWGMDTEPLPALEERAYFGLGDVGTAPGLPGGSPELARACVAALGKAQAVLLARHGVVAVGATPQHALGVAEAVEHLARVGWLSRDRGRISSGHQQMRAL